MKSRVRESRPASFWLLAIVFSLFVLFMYGPMLVIFILSFQGPEGGLTFPIRGLSLHWFYKLAEGLGVVDIGAALRWPACATQAIATAIGVRSQFRTTIFPARAVKNEIGL